MNHRFLTILVWFGHILNIINSVQPQVPEFDYDDEMDLIEEQFEALIGEFGYQNEDQDYFRYFGWWKNGTIPLKIFNARDFLNQNPEGCIMIR